MDRIAVVGASLAGLRAVQALRDEGYAGQLTLIGDERPYDRPPLSKEVLAGEREPGDTALATDEELAALDLDARFGRRATGLDLAARTVALDDGSSVGFDGLIIATGARPRTLPGAPPRGVHVLRTLDDCIALRAAFDASPRVVVIGAGFIGAEVAAAARGRGLDVTVLEAEPVPMAPKLGEQMGGAVARLHRSRGVDLRCGVRVDRFVGADRVEAVRLADGTDVPADVVVVGIGVRPNTEWLAGSGLTVDDGVVCDATCAAAPGVYAAGDVARWHNELFGESMRIEHWTNAGEQAAAAAHNLLAGDAAQPYAPVPYFWSDQYDVKIQLAGRPRADDTLDVIAGSVDDDRFAVTYSRAGRVTACLAFSWPRYVMQYRAQIARGG